jgi:hypothetical protein
VEVKIWMTLLRTVSAHERVLHQTRAYRGGVGFSHNLKHPASLAPLIVKTMRVSVGTHLQRFGIN